MNIGKSAVIVIAIVAAIMILTLVAIMINERPSGITAKDAAELSDEYATEWNSNSRLINVGVTDYSGDPNQYPDGENGRYDEWFCLYGVQASNGTNASSVLYKVCSNGTVTEHSANDNVSALFELDNEFIIDWFIDSDEAYEIAIENVKVQDWLEQHPESKLNLFHLDRMDLTTWHILWIDRSEPYATHLSVGMLADTGEILLVTEN